MINRGMVEPGRSLTSIFSTSQSGKLPAGTTLEIKNSNDQALFRLSEAAPAFYPDPGASDQGAASTDGNKTVKDYVDSIGSDKGTIILTNDGSGATTTYTFSTSETIPSNIALRVENGAVISIDSGVTLTINGPFSAGLYQVFSGDGSVSFGESVTDYYASWFGASSSATATTNSAAIAKVLASIPASTESGHGSAVRTLHLPSGTIILSETMATESLDITEIKGHDTTLYATSDIIYLMHIGNYDSSALSRRRLIINGIYFKGGADSAHRTVATGLFIDGCRNTIVKNCKFRYFKTVALLQGNASYSSGFINNSYYRNEKDFESEGDCDGSYHELEEFYYTNSIASVNGGSYGIKYDTCAWVIGDADAVHVSTGQVCFSSCYFECDGADNRGIKTTDRIEELIIDSCRFRNSALGSGNQDYYIELINYTRVSIKDTIFLNFNNKAIKNNAATVSAVKRVNISNVNTKDPTDGGIDNLINDWRHVVLDDTTITDTRSLAFTAGDTTPSVKGANFFFVDQGSATDITYFDDGVKGQEITLLFQDNLTTLKYDANKLILEGGTDWNPDNYDTLKLKLIGTIWYELSRSDNSP